MKKIATVLFDEEGEHRVMDDDNIMCPGCNATNQPTDKVCRNCNEVLK